MTSRGWTKFYLSSGSFLWLRLHRPVQGPDHGRRLDHELRRVQQRRRGHQHRWGERGRRKRNEGMCWQGYNYGHSGNKIIKRGGNRTHPVDGITERIENSRKDGWISCKWKRSAEMMIGRCVRRPELVCHGDWFRKRGVVPGRGPLPPDAGTRRGPGREDQTSHSEGRSRVNPDWLREGLLHSNCIVGRLWTNISMYSLRPCLARREDWARLGLSSPSLNSWYFFTEPSWSGPGSARLVLASYWPGKVTKGSEKRNE